ncbi:MAG: tetratricopeptide repeat protein [Xanthomonadales bacterium]|nr:tetratricopeptide repeat protein [Xanthomonadales bacterium]
MASAAELLRHGMGALNRGDAVEALAHAEQVLAGNPEHLDALLLAGQALRALDRTHEAVDRLDEARRLAPAHPGLLSNLAALRLALGEPDRAVRHAREAARLDPEHFGAQLNLGLALLALKDYEASSTALERAEQLRPGQADVLRALAKARYRAGRAHLSARPLLEKAMALFPEDPELRALRADSLIQTAQTSAGIEAYRELLEREEGLPAADRQRYYSAYLLALQYDPDTSPADLLHAHQAWAEGLPEADSLARAGRGGEALRIGWLSPRFGPGPVASFLPAVLEAMRGPSARHYLYSGHRQGGPVSQRFRGSADAWRDLDELSPRAAAEAIAADRLDVLVDLAGHAPGGMLAALCYRPAPVQVTWLDSFCTTGLPEMDLFISDEVLTPVEDERWFTERIARLPGGRLCYRPQAVAPEPAARPAGDQVVFASFNRLSKLGDPVLQAWARILDAVPGAQLRVRNSLFEDPAAREDFLARCGRAGMDAARVSLHGYCSYSRIMADYQDVDIALDPFPFSGCTTTCDALWMGVPVVTRRGETLVSRQSASILQQLGLHDWIAESKDDYVTAAVRLANDVSQRRALRATLRESMQSAFRPAAFAGELLALLRAAVDQPGS